MEHYHGYSYPSPLPTITPPNKQRFLRNRGHDFILPAVKTERFKRSFIDWCLFNFIELYLILNSLHCHVCKATRML